MKITVVADSDIGDAKPAIESQLEDHEVNFLYREFPAISTTDGVLRANAPDLVLNFSYGVAGRYSSALLPLLLDDARIPYVGSDAQALCVCQERQTLYNLLRATRIPTPNFVALKAAELDSSKIEDISYPVVVKPNSQRGAKGIGDFSFCKSYDDIIGYCVEALRFDPEVEIIIEEYLPGFKEYSLTARILDDKVKLLPVLVYDHSYHHTELLSLSRRITMVEEGKSPYMVDLKPHKKLESIFYSLARRVVAATGCQDWVHIDVRQDKVHSFCVFDVDPILDVSRGGGLLGRALLADEATGGVLFKDAVMSRVERQQMLMTGNA